MTARWILPTLIISLVMVSCVREEHQLIMSSPIVSLTHSRAPDQSLKQGRYIQVRWCRGDKSYLEENQNPGGLVEQVLAKAHAETKSAYFLNANFYQEAVSSLDWSFTGWNPCVTLRGHTSTAPLPTASQPQESAAP